MFVITQFDCKVLKSTVVYASDDVNDCIVILQDELNKLSKDTMQKLINNSTRIEVYERTPGYVYNSKQLVLIYEICEYKFENN